MGLTTWNYPKIVRFDNNSQLSEVVPHNKGRGRLAGFTCKQCEWRYYNPEPDYIRAPKIGVGAVVHFSHLRGLSRCMALNVPKRCKDCNNGHSRFKRARRSLEHIWDHAYENDFNVRFITLTLPNTRLGSEPPTFPFLNRDRKVFVEAFKEMRRSSWWKKTVPGTSAGYWFYEATVRRPWDVSKNRLITEYELNGHLHILLSSANFIPQEEIQRAWEGIADIRIVKKSEDNTDKILTRYLSSYLKKEWFEGTRLQCSGRFGINK